MMKKLVCIIFAALLMVGMTACDGRLGIEAPPVDPPVVDKSDIVIDIPEDTDCTLRMLIPGGNSNEEEMVRKAIEGFQKKYKNVKFKLDYVPVNSYEGTILNMSNNLPDILWTNSPDFYFLAANNYALPLDKYVEASEAADVFHLEEDFYKQYFDIGSLNGNLYAVPRSVDSVVTFYNREMLTNAGVDLSLVKDGWTWDTFLSVCYKVRTYLDNSGKQDAFVLDANLTSWLSVCYPMLRSYGADVFDENKNLIIDSPETKACIEEVRQLVKDRIIVDSTQSSGSSFELGTSAFLFQSASVSLFANRKALKGKIDIVSFPLINETTPASPKIGCGIAGYSINADSKLKNESWAFISYMLSYEGQQNMALGGLNLPSIRRDLADYKTANWGKGYETMNLNAYLYGMDLKITTDFLSKYGPDKKPDLDQALKDLFNNACNKNKTIDACISKAVENFNDALITIS